MYAILALDTCVTVLAPLALVLSLVARFTGKARTGAVILAWLALLAALTPLCAGAGGYLWSMSRVEAAVQFADPSQRAILQAAGEAESAHNLSFGIGSGCCALVPVVLALMLIPPKRENWDAA